jgi:hypothetical protein
VSPGEKCLGRNAIIAQFRIARTACGVPRVCGFSERRSYILAPAARGF